MGILDFLMHNEEGESKIPGVVSGGLGVLLSMSPLGRVAGLRATTALNSLTDVAFEALTQVSDGKGTARDLAQGTGAVTGGALGSLIVSPTVVPVVKSMVQTIGLRGLAAAGVVVASEVAVGVAAAYVGGLILQAIFDAASDTNKASLETELLRSLNNSIQSRNQIALDALLRGEENWERFQDRLDGITEDANSKGSGISGGMSGLDPNDPRGPWQDPRLVPSDPLGSTDFTSTNIRQIGIDAYVARQQEAERQAALAQARADAAGGGSGGGGGGGADSGQSGSYPAPRSPTSNPTSTSTTPMTGGIGSLVTSGVGGVRSASVGPAGGPVSITQSQDDHTATEDRRPVLLDLDGNGIQINDITRSAQFIAGDDGLQHRTAWAGTGDGVLFYDVGGDGKITEQREYVFTDWDPTAKDDMAALRSHFDTNNDGKLTSADAEFANFKVMVTNPDGTTTAWALSDADTIAGNDLHITSLDLRTDTTHVTLDDGSQITGQTSFTMNGTQHTAATVTLTAEANGHQVTQTTSSTGAGNKTIVSVTRDASGQVIGTMKSEGAGLGQPFRKCNAVFGKGTELARKIDEPTTAKT